jgi:small subunit ribosomal protein S9
MPEIVHESGKRKRSIARATIKAGKGQIRINSKPLSHYSPSLARERIMEPLQIAGDELIKKLKIEVNARGGGIMSQAEAARLAISRALVAYTQSKKLEKDFLDYDRHLLVADTRRKEACKPNDSKARAKRQKSYR